MEEASAVVEQFLSYLKYEKRFSEHTAKCYGADLVQFGDFLSEMHHVDSSPPDALSLDHGHGHAGTATAVATRTEAKVDHLLLSADVNEARSYLAHLNEKGYSKATIARKLATLRSFYKFLVKTNRCSTNPLIAVLPRLLIGPVAWLVWRALERRPVPGLIVAGTAGSLTNTTLVLGIIGLLGKAPWGVLLPLIVTNGLPEAIASAIITLVVVAAWKRIAIGNQQGSKI